jgi:multidrug resistance efflux pump
MLVERRADRVGGLQSRLRLAQALDGNSWEARFRRVKDLRAPTDGRLFYLPGWNDQSEQQQKYQKGFSVWGGATVAEVLDMSHLAFRAELGEPEYRRVKPGQRVDIVFPQFNARRVPGVISAIGHALYVPKDQLADNAAGRAAAASRVFNLTVDFTPPSDLAELLVPDTKGVVELP